MNQEYFIPILVAGTILLLIFVFFILSYILINTRRQHRNSLENARLIVEHEKELLNAQIREQERAMSQISREIHDNVSQKIDFLQMNIKAIKESNALVAHAKSVENSLAIAEQIGNDLRNISYTLNGDYVTAHGLSSILRKELDYIGSAHGIVCDLLLKCA